jgi:hypothetical protein
MALGSMLVAGGAATNQLLTGDHRLSWTAAYFALVFTVLGVLLDRLPSRTSAGKDRTSRRRYLRRVRASVEQMETIGLVTQAEYVLRTRQVYVDVALQPRTVTETMPDGGVGGVVAAAGTRMPLASFLTRGRVLAVLGAAGSGKTTLVRYTALKMAERRWWPWQTEFWRPRRIPLLLYLRDHAQAILAEPPQNLAAIGSAAPWLEGAVTGPWLQRRLERGQCAVLLDGLDEVADAQERAAVVAWVNTQISRYPGNTVVITSRPLGYEANRVAQADVLQVQRFTNLQIAEFLDAWFHAIEHRARQGADPGEIDRIAARGADDLMGRITAMPALLDLAANPLLLTMIANVHRYRGSLPGRRADLYAEMCQVLLHRRQEAKNLAASHPGLDELGGDAKERLMRRLAWAMMVRHQRDIPIADAETAIGTLPHRSGPVLTAQVFLDYARRSGLLLEHKPGHYGFTHLSLQEYLAATHVPGDDDHRRVLIDHVGDPWWRETILLWAARYDASPVVEACLAVRTVPALSLAYACADQAAELDQHLRDQLTKLLTSTPDDPAEVRLLDGVAADRQLGDFLQLDDGTTICATPVSQDLWNRYLRHLRSGDSLASSPAPTPTAVSEPIRGLWAADLPGFLSWLNGLSDDRPIYCFPTYAELVQLSDWIKTLPGTVWSYDEPGGYRLYQPEGISHPHFPTAAQLRSYPYLIIDRTYLLLHLATNTKLRLARLLLFGYLASRQDLPSRPEYRLVSTLDLVATIDAIRTLDSARASDIEPALERAFEHARARTRAHAHDLDLDRARALERAIQRALQRALDHARALARELDLALDLDRDFDTAEALDAALAHDRGLALAVAYDLDRSRDAGLDPAYDLDLDLALSRALDHARDLDLVLDPALHHAPDLDLDHALEIALDHARNLDNDPGLAPDQVVALDYDLDQALTRDPDSDLDRIRNLAQDLARALDHARDLDLDRALDLDRDLARARGLDHTLDLGLELFRDLAVARRLQSDRWCLEVTWAGIGLLEAWTSRHARGMKVAPGLHAFMAEVLDECAQTEPQDDPHAALELVIRAISEHEKNTWALALLGHAQELIAPPRGCDVQAAQNNSGVAAAMVLAAILAITAPASGGQGDDPHVILLRGVLTALISLTVPENKNQTVLLARV